MLFHYDDNEIWKLLIYAAKLDITIGTHLLSNQLITLKRETFRV